MLTRGESSSDATYQVLAWCREVTKGYQGVDLGGETTGGLALWSRPWNDGLAFCALLHAHFPDKIGPFKALDVSNSAGREHALKLAFKVAHDAGIPDLLDVEDMVTTYPRPDAKSIFLYVSEMYKRLRGLDSRQHGLQAANAPGPEPPTAAPIPRVLAARTPSTTPIGMSAASATSTNHAAVGLPHPTPAISFDRTEPPPPAPAPTSSADHMALPPSPAERFSADRTAAPPRRTGRIAAMRGHCEF